VILKAARIGNPVVRAPAAPVPDAEIGSPETRRLIEDMVETMREYDGVGIAAVQVHVPKRIAVLEVAGPHPRYPDAPPVPLQVLVNPEILEYGSETEEDWEGCLSVPGLRGKVPRAKEVRVRAFDADGNRKEFTASGFHARIVQHECDHLDGRVYLDRMNGLESLSYLEEFKRFND
jgi:peptide deformylase